jgi:Holliday junction resolvasome RuvABC ATP-dependent DNA helicase subunit
MKRRPTVSSQDIRTTLAVVRALKTYTPTDLMEIVRTDPGISVHKFCEQYLAGLDVRCSRGTPRAYAAVYQRIHRARKKLGLIPAQDSR